MKAMILGITILLLSISGLGQASSFQSRSGNYQGDKAIFWASSNDVYNVRRVGKKVRHFHATFVEFKLTAKPGFWILKDASFKFNGKQYFFFAGQKKGFFKSRLFKITKASIHSAVVELNYSVCLGKSKNKCNVVKEKLSVSRSSNFIMKNGKLTYKRGPKNLIIKKL